MRLQCPSSPQPPRPALLLRRQPAQQSSKCSLQPHRTSRGTGTPAAAAAATCSRTSHPRRSRQSSSHSSSQSKRWMVAAAGWRRSGLLPKQLPQPKQCPPSLSQQQQPRELQSSQPWWQQQPPASPQCKRPGPTARCPAPPARSIPATMGRRRWPLLQLARPQPTRHKSQRSRAAARRAGPSTCLATALLPVAAQRVAARRRGSPAQAPAACRSCAKGASRVSAAVHSGPAWWAGSLQI